MCDAAIRVFSQRGFENTTLEAIARAAGVSVGLIYRYFKNKEDLLYYAILEILAAYAAAIPQAVASARTPLERFVAAVHAYAKVIDHYKSVALVGYRVSGSLGRRRLKGIIRRELETNKLLADVVDDCIAAGVFRRIDAQMFTYQVVVFTHSWVIEAWRLPRNLTIARFVERGLALMLPAVLTASALQSPVTRALLDRRESPRVTTGAYGGY
jgi:AcrR family transcriptional regulator